MKLFETISAMVKKRKKLTIFLVAVLVVVIYFIFNFGKPGETPTRYVLARAEKGSLIVSVSGSGEIAVSNQIDIKPKTSGEVTAMKVKEGDAIKAGEVIAQIDGKDALKSVRDAEINLKSAQIALDKLQKPADKLSLIQAQNALAQAQRDFAQLKKPATDSDLLQTQNAVAQAQRDLEQAQNNIKQQNLDSTQTLEQNYEDGYNAVSNAFLDLPDIIQNLKLVNKTDENQATNNIEYYKFFLGNDSAFISTFLSDYNSSLNLYTTTFDNFKKTPRSSNKDVLFKLIDDTSAMANAVSQALEDARNIMDAIYSMDYQQSPIASTIDSLRPKIQSDIGTINTTVTNLKKIKNTLQTTLQSNPMNDQKSRDAIALAEEKLKEKQAALEKLQEGATPEDLATSQEKLREKQAALEKLQEGPDNLDLASQQLAIQQRRDALADAQSNLDDYSIRAPFDGIVAKINVQKGDTVSSGSAVITAITKDFLAQISLNEVDAAKVKLGNKATLTFDAFPDLTLTGEVMQLDILGTVSQGVVSYNAKIAFDTSDDRVKPGMSVSAAIITQVKTDALLIPNSAVKSQNDVHYVEYFDASSKLTTIGQANTVSSNIAPQQKTVEIGLANDTQTEIVSGLAEGDEVISQTITASTKQTQSSTSNALRLPGIGGGNAGAGTGRNTQFIGR